MIDLFRAVSLRGEQALRRGAWSFAGVGLIVLAFGFGAAALVEALSAVIPRYAALGAAAFSLIIAAAVCFFLARGPGAPPPAAPTAAAAQAAFAAPGDWRSALNRALIEEAREKPARAAALAALAGLILGVLEGLDDAPKAKGDT